MTWFLSGIITHISREKVRDMVYMGGILCAYNGYIHTYRPYIHAMPIFSSSFVS